MSTVKLLRIVLIGLLQIVSVFSSAAQVKLPANYHHETLPNGLQILVIEDYSNPLVHFNMVFRFGAKVETSDQDGLSHLYEHMFFTASREYPSTASFQKEISRLGIEVNALTNRESVHGYFSQMKTNWRKGFRLFANGMIHPVFQDEELELQKRAVNDEINGFLTDPYYRLNLLTIAALWGPYVSRKNVSGDLSIINAASTDQLEAMRDNYHRPDNALLIVAGDVSKEEALIEIRAAFSSWERSNESTLQQPSVYQPLATSSFVMQENDAVESPALMVAWSGPGIAALQSMMAAHLLAYLCTMESSNFYKELDRVDLFYDYYVGIRPGTENSTFFMELYPDAKTVDESLVWLDKMIQSWQKDPSVLQETLDLAKHKMQIETYLEQEDLSEYILTLGDRWAIGGERYGFDYLSLIQSVSLADIQQFIDDYLDRPRSYGLVVSTKQRKQLHRSMKEKFVEK